MWEREQGVSSYRWPLLLVLCCLREEKRDQKGTRKRSCVAVRKWRKNKTQREEGEEKATEVTFSGNVRPDQVLHHTIIICCHRLPSNPSCCFAGGSFLTTRLGGGCCYCCWPPIVTPIYCASVSSTVQKHDPLPLVNIEGGRVQVGWTCPWRGKWELQYGYVACALCVGFDSDSLPHFGSGSRLAK